MTKRLLILLAICSLSLASLNGCTSKESKDDAEVATDAPAAAGGDNLEAVDGSATPPVAGATADALPEDSLESALSETPPTAEAPAPSAPSSSDLKAAEPTLDMPSDPASEPSLGAPSSSGIADIEPPAKESKPKAETASSETPAPAAASLQKIPDAPFQQSGILLNTVYIARPGDTVSSVSQMIYSADKTSELKKANPKLKNRDPRPSEKIFYNSPVRPTDAEKMMTYYEDNGMKAETYIAQEGDTIQKVGKNLLGYDKGWKEIWTTNAIESKGKLEAGTEIKYYKGPAAPATKIASNEAAPAAKEELPPPPASMGEASALPPPPPPDMAANNQPPPPNDMNGPPPPPPPAMNDLPPPPPPEAAAPPPPPPAMNDLPPPPPPEAAAPPPPPPPAAPVEKKMPAVAKAGESMDEETMFALGGIAVAALGLTAILVAKRKRRQKELEAAFNETQVGT